MHDEHDDVTLEPENNEAPKGGDADAKVAKQKAEIERLRSEKQEYLDGWQRAKADYVNALKRFEEEREAAIRNGTVTAIMALLPAYDALERAKEHGEMPDGFAAIAKQLESAFATLGVETIGEVGEHFDLALHEALGQDPTDDAQKDDTITVVLEKGLRAGSIIVRPAKVKVAEFK